MSFNSRSPAVLSLSETLGISKQRCITLLAASSGDVERAADIHYSQQQQASKPGKAARGRAQPLSRRRQVNGKEEKEVQEEQQDRDSKEGDATVAAAAAAVERKEQESADADDDDMPQLESSTTRPPPLPLSSLPSSTVAPPFASSSTVSSHSRSVRPVRHLTSPAASSSSASPVLSAARVKSELGSGELLSSSSSTVPKAKPALFASSSLSSAVKREPGPASSSASASVSAHSGRPKAPTLFSASAPTSSQPKAEPASVSHTALSSASAAISPQLPVSSSSSPAPSLSAAQPRVDRVSVRIIDTINPDTLAINMRFPLDTTLHKVYAELERRGFPGVKLYHAKSELSPELTPRELCLVDKCVLEMEYGQQLNALKRTTESKEAEPGAKRQRVEPSRTGKEEKGQHNEVAEEKLNDYQEAPPSVARPDHSSPPAPAPSSAPSVVEPVSLHVETPVTFTRLRLACVQLHVRTRLKALAKRHHNLAELYTAVRGGATPSTMTVASAQDELLMTLLSEINSGQRHPIGIEVRWQRVQAAQPADSSSEEGSTVSEESPSAVSAVMSLVRAALGASDDKKQPDKFKWLHTFDVELYLLPVCIGWSITHMNELLELLWGEKWQQLMSRVWSERYRPGDGKPMPPMDQTSLLRMAQRFEYHATLDESVLSARAPFTFTSLSPDSNLIASGSSSSPFPFRIPRPYESSERVGLRYLVQREQQKAASAWLDGSELDPHQLSLESCVALSLRDYQQQSVLWMLGQELRESVSEGLWVECRVDGQPLLYSPLFQQWRMGPLESTRGGLLCDTMGLGKTIVSLALINLRPAPAEFCTSSLAASYVASPSRPVRSLATLIIAPVSLVPQWESELRQHSLRPLRIYCFYGSNRETDPRVIAQYDVVLTTYGVLVSDTSGQRFRRRKGAPSIFHCIEWWRVIIDEGHSLRASNTRSAQTNAATAILSQQRHILTGTPISSSVTELRGLFAFLQCQLLADSPSFWSHLQAVSRATPALLPPTEAEERSYRYMTFPPYAVYAVAEEIFCRLSMRHTKDQPFNGRPTLAPLPPRTDAIHKVDFTPTQRAAYEELYAIARRKWDELVRRGAASSAVIPALSYLLPLRQACSGTIIDMAEVRRREAEAAQRLEEAKRAEESQRAHAASMMLPALPNDADENDDEAGEEGSLRQYPYATTLPYNSLEDECVVCLSEFNLPLQTRCGHLFCSECILSVIDMESEPTCPQCRARVTKTTLRRPRPRPKTPPPPPPPVMEEATAPAALSSSAPSSFKSAAATAAAASSSSSSPSLPVDSVVFDSKLEVVVSHILQLQRSDPATKALVFSQFTSTLTYLCTRLTSLHVTVHRISGDMPMTARRRVLHSFNTTATFSVFLLTPRVGAVGLTLTSASHCYIVEPALNWTLTEQAVGRVHRLGQQRPVTCVHYVMRGSVEEKIEAVTREKRGAGQQDGEGAAAAADSASSARAAGVSVAAPVEGAGIGTDAMLGLNTMGSMKKDAAVYRVQELEKLFER